MRTIKSSLVDATPDRYRALVLAAVGTGLRWGELAALRVSDLDLLRNRLTVRQTASRDRGRIVYTPGKTAASRRSVSLSADLVEVLARHLADYPTDSLVVTAEEGGPLRATNFRRRVWLPALREADLEGVRFHDLRHTHASWLIEAGQHPQVIASRLGHKSVRTVLDVYGHLLEGLDEAAADAVNDAISTARTTPTRKGRIAPLRGGSWSRCT